MPSKQFATILLTFAIALTTAAFAQDATPPRSSTSQVSYSDYTTEHPAKTINAIVVKSWGDNPVWADLSTNWSTYGKIAVSVDHTTLIGSDFTYQDLVKSKANVIILSDVSGGGQQYSAAEIAAVLKYAKKGHSVLGTYATLQYNSYDNRGLAPVFGFKSSLTYATIGISGTFNKDASKSCLMKKLPKSWQSLGFNESQVPSSNTWKGNLDKAKKQADSDSLVGVVSLYTAKTYSGIYISNMPEYLNVGGNDEQLLYNAITCYAK